jgi:hypothetical protein
MLSGTLPHSEVQDVQVVRSECQLIEGFDPQLNHFVSGT